MSRCKSWLFGAAMMVTAGLLGAEDADLRHHVEFLASNELEGRLTGSDGAALAVDYLAERLRDMGAKPLPGVDAFQLPFDFTAGVNDNGSSIVVGAASWSGEESIRALSFSDSEGVSGEVVFAGYGLVVPEGQDFGYDSYATLDVEDKVVLVLRYLPEDADQDTRAQLSRYSGLRYKALAARERGARALLVVTGPNSPNAGETIPMSFDTAIAGSGIVAASVSAEVADAILQPSGRSLAEVQSELDTANPHVTGFAVPETQVSLEVAVLREHRTGHNVAGYFPATVEKPLDKRFVVVGAHFDHLGLGRHGNSLAGKAEIGLPHLGADDNASGVAAVLSVASALSRADHQRDIVVAFWSGEELGLLGSTHFVDNGPLTMEDVAAYVNFDMVGRSEENKLTLQAVGTSPVWSGLIERSNVPVGFDLSLQDDPYLPTDSSAFHQAGVPTLNFFTGSHADYHRPSDRPQAINYEDLERVAQLGYLITTKLVALDEAPQFVQVERKRQTGGDRDTVRAFTGTIPDYATEVEGLLLSGVIEGGPADEAGLQKGDVIVEFGGQIDRQHLRLHLRPRRGEDRRAVGGGLHARWEAHGRPRSRRGLASRRRTADVRRQTSDVVWARRSGGVATDIASRRATRSSPLGQQKRRLLASLGVVKNSISLAIGRLMSDVRCLTSDVRRPPSTVQPHGVVEGRRLSGRIGLRTNPLTLGEVLDGTSV